MAKSNTEVQSSVTSEDKIVPIATLIANESNPRKIHQKQFAALKKSLQDFPEMKQLRMIVVDENMKILGGHQRILALQELGYTDVEVKQVFGLTEKQKREFIIKDNTAAGEWDTDIIANQWDIEELEQWGVPNFNFGDIGDADKKTGEATEKDLHTCPGCGLEFSD